MTTSFALLGSTTLGSSGNTVTVSGLTARKYLIVELFCIETGGAIRANFTFNSDTGSNYSLRTSTNGAADSTNVSQPSIFTDNQTENQYYRLFLVNISANEKLVILNEIGANTAGAGNAPRRNEIVGKWSNTSAQITTITATNDVAGNFNTGTIMTVYGSD